MGATVGTAYLIAGEKVEENDVQVVSAERTYRVRTAFAATAATALAATGLPIAREQHPVFNHLRVLSRSPKLQENGIVWDIDVKYGPATAAQETYNLVRIEYGTHTLQEDVLYNLGTNKPLLDANLMPFENTIQEANEYPYIKIVKKQKSVSRTQVITLSGTINNAAVTVAGVSVAKHAGRIKIVATENPDDLWPWEITYEVMVRAHSITNYVDFAGVLQAGPTDIGWDVGIINRGYYCYDVDSTQADRHNTRCMENILDAAGSLIERRPTATPVPLALDGSRLADGSTPILIRVQTIREGAWGPLGLNSL
jgi:hypothetical protein